MLERVYGSEGGTETLDVLMKYLYAFLSNPLPSTRGPLLFS